MFRDHPLRASLSSEMHVRRLPPVRSPARLMQVVIVNPDDRIQSERDALAALLGDGVRIAPDQRYLRHDLGDIHVIWERHTEFSSYLFIREGTFAELFDYAPFERIPRQWFRDLPGEVIRATQLALVTAVDEATIASSFAEQDLVVCDVADGAARLWSDFRLHDDGFGRLLLVDQGLTPGEAALVIQRVQELGNYRNLTLLGLPVAQRLAPRLGELETRLATVTSAVSAGASSDDDLLQELSGLSAELAHLINETRYRMSASRAYAQITSERLHSLRIGRVKGRQALDDFTDRRLLPAVRTCVSFDDRLEDLSRRVAWTSGLLRTRVDTQLARHNRDLLASMDRRTDLQLRLQHTVEGLSVVAISYYLIGLIGYLLPGSPVHLPHDITLAAAVPVVLVAVGLGLSRMRRRLHAAGRPGDDG